VAGVLADLFTPSAIIVVNSAILCGLAAFMLARKHGTLQKV
jgi:hypothetical protein